MRTPTLQPPKRINDRAEATQVSENTIVIKNPKTIPPEIRQAILPLSDGIKSILVSYIENTLKYTSGNVKTQGDTLLKFLKIPNNDRNGIFSRTKQI